MKRDAKWFADNYGPYVAIAAVIILLVALAPSKAQRQFNQYAGGGTGAGGQTAPGDGATVTTGAEAATSGAAAGATGASGGAGNGLGSGGSRGGPVSPATAAIPTGKGRYVGEDCSRRKILGSGATCKPLWEGDNGGATYRGVTGDTITVLYYAGKPIPLVDQALNSVGYADSPEEQERALKYLEDWFNANYQTYGRRVKLQWFRSNADATDAAANRAEAVAIAQQKKAFAVAATVLNQTDFMDELARQGVECFGCGIQQPGKFYKDRLPFIWTLLPDGDTTNDLIAEYIGKRLGRSSKADWAGPLVQGKDRRYGLVYPQDVYAANADDLERKLGRYGIPVARKVAYASDINTATQQATNAVQQLRNAGVTTVLCVCDPVAPVFLTQTAAKQQYYPEWFQTGYFGQDLDLAARFYDQTEWKYNFGTGIIPPGDKPENGAGYKIYRERDKTGRVPSTMTANLAPLLLLFSTIEANGPIVDPGTVRDTIWSKVKLRNTNKFTPAYAFGPNDFGGIDDADEIWWDPAATGPDGQQGTYRGVNDFRRYLRGQWPATRPQVFKPECTPRGSCGAVAGPAEP